MKIHNALVFLSSVALLLGTQSCGGSSGGGSTAEAATEGDVVVRVKTEGDATVDNEYLVTIGDMTEPVGPNGTVVFSSVPVGVVTVGLGGLHPDCRVLGQNPITLRLNGPIELDFEVSCVATTGTVAITTVTNGDVDPDEDGYSVAFSDRQRGIGRNETVEFTGVEPGSYNVTIDGLAGNCTVNGSASPLVSVTAGQKTELTVTIDCVPKGEIDITFETVGNGAPDTDGYVLDLPDESIEVGTDEMVTSPRLVAGDIQLTLLDLARRCTVEGDNPRVVTVDSGQTATTTFTVACNSSQLWASFEGTLLDRGAQPQPHDGMIVGDAAFTPDMTGDGQAIALDGDGDWITFDNSNELDVSGSAYTVGLWMRPATVAGTQVLWAKASQGEIAGVNTPALYLEGDELRFGLFGGTPLTVQTGIVADSWYHIVIAHDGATLYRAYVNAFAATPGVLGPTNEGANGEADWTFSIGSSTGWPTGDFQGTIDDVVFFGRELSQIEVIELRTDGPARL